MLYRGMYTSAIVGESSTRFGLWAGQFHAYNFLADAQWYSQKGELLGSGDISSEDVSRIRSELHQDEMFILLRQHALWPLDHIDVISPGISLICKTASYAIAPGIVYALDQKGVYGRGQKINYCGIEINMISPESLLRLIG